jgi:hypothetical protein
VEILERTDHMVLAAHPTPVGGGLTAVTVETVTLEPPRRIGFRLCAGRCRTSSRASPSVQCSLDEIRTEAERRARPR